MKELSIEQKAKAYDEALEKLRSLHDNYDTVSTLIDIKEELEHIFPELNESEDERIINNIKKVIGWYRGMFTEKSLMPEEYQEINAWLEKQGEHANFRNKIQIGDKVTRNEDGVLVNLSQLNRVDKKQGEKPADKVKPKFKIGDEIRTCNEESLTITKIDEKGYWSGDLFVCSFEDSAKWELVGKLVDNVEPKFHKGEWLCENEQNNYARFIQILEIVNVQGKDRYRISRDIHNDEDVVEFGFVEKYYHKFDIQDAKDGDVLVDEYNNIGINKEIEGICWHSYIYLGSDNHLYGFSIGGSHMQNNTKPATKEQRDLLFQKMKESGYEWDAEKKKLKKIEQEPTNKIEPDILIEESYQQQADDLIDMVTEKPADWSEEDELRLDDIKTIIEESIFSKVVRDKNLDWLKSLKDRYTWKPSDEQMNLLREVQQALLGKDCHNRFVNFMYELKRLREE